MNGPGCRDSRFCGHKLIVEVAAVVVAAPAAPRCAAPYCCSAAAVLQTPVDGGYTNADNFAMIMLIAPTDAAV